MTYPDALHPDTLAISSGRDHEPGAPANVPPYLTSTFREGADVVYTRHGNPTWTAFEHTIGALEGGRAVAFSSGMAAVMAVLEGIPLGAKVVAPEDAYYGARLLLTDLQEAGRLSVEFVDIADTDAVIKAVEGEAALLWIESPTNPMMKIADVPALAEAAHVSGAKVAVDNTFATPILQRPLELGADLVVHSASKYISGHSDVVMGVVVAHDGPEIERIERHRSVAGAIPGPMEVFLAHRGLRTLHLRVERAQMNAADLALRLERHEAVGQVLYPGLPAHPNFQRGVDQMRGGGAMIAFIVKGGAEAADAVCHNVKLIAWLTSLGGLETSIERRARWKGEDATPPGLIRMSVGCEYLEDIWADLERALDA